MLNKLCPPALLYLGFSLTQIIIDTFKGFYNVAFFKSIVMVIFTLLLNIMCVKGLSIISWIIVFIPFILMTYITVVLMFVFGLSPSSDNLDYNVDYPDDNSNTKVVVVDSNSSSSSSSSDEYNPDDYTSGTPEDINNYN